MSYMHRSSMRHLSMVGALLALASGAYAAESGPATVLTTPSTTRQAGSLWQPKLRNTRITVAAMKRHARTRRNVRARSAK